MRSYKLVVAGTKGCTIDVPSTTERLNELAKDGWKVVLMSQSQEAHANTGGPYLVFLLEKSEQV